MGSFSYSPNGNGHHDTGNGRDPARRNGTEPELDELVDKIVTFSRRVCQREQVAENAQEAEAA